MDLITTLNNLILSQESAFVAGLIGALTPCVLAVTPVLLYRFGIWPGQQQDTKSSKLRIFLELLVFLIGFFISFGLTGLLVSQLANSTYTNTVRLVGSMLLIFIGILQLFDYLQINIIQKYSHPFVIGLIIPLVISFSPCVLPFFSTLATGSFTPHVISRFVLFGIGLLFPALLIAILGNFALTSARKSSRFIARVQKFSPLLVILSGIYLGTQMIEINKLDVLLTSIFLLILIAFSFYNILRQRELRTFSNYRNFLVILSIWMTATLLLLIISPDTPALGREELLRVCTGITENQCEICGFVEIVFLTVTSILAFSILRSRKPGKQFKLKF